MNLSNFCSSLLTMAVILLYVDNSQCKKSEKSKEKDKTPQCEVCVKFMTNFVGTLPSSATSDPAQLKTLFMEACAAAQNKEERFCYHVGGSEISATSIVDEILPFIQNSFPPEKICEKIKLKIPDICEIKYDKPIDLSNLQKLKVKDLKNVLANWGQANACKGCAEKQDFIRVIEELMPKYAPEFVQAKTEL